MLGIFSLLSLFVPSEPGAVWPWSDLVFASALALPFLWKRWKELALYMAVPLFLLRAGIYQSLDLIALALGPVLFAVLGIKQVLTATWADFKSPGNKGYYLWCLAAWLVVQGAMPPLPLGPLVFIALIPWFWVLRNAPKGVALRATFWANIPAQLLSYYWITNVVQAGFALAIGGGLVLLLIFLSLFPVLLAWVYQNLSRRWLWLFPFFAVGLEVLRSKGDLAFPWGPMAAALGKHLELLQASAWIGGIGLSFLIYFSNQCSEFLLHRKKYFALPLLLAIPVGLWSFGAWRLAQPTPAADTLKVLLLQPNQDQKLKWDKDYFDELMQKTWDLLKSAPLKGHDLVVLPETSIPNFASMAEPWPQRFDTLSRQVGVPFIFGVLDYEYDESSVHSARFYNTALYLNPQSSEGHFYRKVRLVPFSEALPFGKILPMINFVDLGEGDFSPGSGPEVLQSAGKSWSPNLCYEIVFGDFVREQQRLGSRLMVEMTNDGWFGESTQPWQHLNLVRLRAVENSIPVVRATNTGVTAVIDSKGRVLASLPSHTAAFLSVNVPLATKPSFFSRWGDAVEWFFFALFWLGLGVAGFLRFRAGKIQALRGD